MITDFYWPFVGGVEQHVRRLSHALAGRGHQVAVATLGNADLPQFEEDGPVRVYRLRSSMQRLTSLFATPERTWAPPFPDPEATLALRKIVQRERPEVVHGHDWLARSFLPLRPFSRARFVMSLHYYTLSCPKKNLMYQQAPCSGPGMRKCLSCAAEHYGLGKGLPIALSNMGFRQAERAAVDLFLPVSQATAAGNGLTDGDRYQVIPNFMPERNGARLDLHPYLSQLPQEPFLLYVGDLRAVKGLEVLLEAYGELESEVPLVLIGKEWAETPKSFSPNVFVYRNWPNEAVLAAWERSLIGLAPSLWPEPFGIVVIEALSRGKPVVASRIGGIPDIVGEDEAGILVTPGDVEGLKEAIRRLLEDAPLRARMGAAALRRAAQFEAEAVVPRIERIYQDLLEGKPIPNGRPSAGQYYRQ